MSFLTPFVAVYELWMGAWTAGQKRRAAKRAKKALAEKKAAQMRELILQQNRYHEEMQARANRRRADAQRARDAEAKRERVRETVRRADVRDVDDNPY